MQQQSPERTQYPLRRESPVGCVLPLIAGIWIVVVSVKVPIGADWLSVPISLKWVITAGHFAALVVLLYPYGTHAKTRAVRWLAAVWVALQVVTLWFWN
jgi:hypothetical protein